jgi:hypothetical protein
MSSLDQSACYISVVDQAITVTIHFVIKSVSEKWFMLPYQIKVTDSFYSLCCYFSVLHGLKYFVYGYGNI